ncbi:TetR/AcrR family transcriptional regulator [Clostridium sp. Ade.TY]|uniref:TetR/AcrR family transcriptional regulator n=1 Tax=Clostridium sp. Ade.TY TaxID=1391647 RepID=UPI0004271E45|nr:TetR/AcrR family transcriptional regulator [Clostridium sp. Ade.TY]
MYKIQTNSLAIKSQNWIANALLKLMESHPYKDITVTQICEEANLVRKTFYRNFDSKEDILHFILDNLFNDFQKDKDFNELYPKEIIYLYYSYWSEHKRLLKLIYENNLFFLVHKKYINYTESFISLLPDAKIQLLEDNKLSPYFFNFIASSMSSILELWIKRDFKESVDAITELTQYLLCSKL